MGATEQEDLRTIEALRGVAPEVAVPILAELLGDEQGMVGFKASETLHRIGPERALAVLDTMLAGQDGNQARAAVSALALMGEAGLRRLMSLVERRDEPLRWEALAQLRRGSSGAFGDIKAYGSALQKHVERVNASPNAADDALDQPTQDALTALRQFTADPDPARRLAATAVLAWAKSGAWAAVPDIARGLEDASCAVRWVAIDTLGEIGRPSRSAVEALQQVVASDDPLLRSGALRALGEIAPVSPEVLAAATRALDDPDWHVREGAAEALGRAGRVAAPAVQALTVRLDDTQPEVRAQAADALGRIGLHSAPAAPRLLACLDDPASAVRLQAAEALTVLGVPEEALPALLANLSLGTAPPAIAMLSPEKTVPFLVDALRSDDASRRQGAASALTYIGSPGAEAIPRLIEMLGSENWKDCERAQDALVAMGPEVAPHMGAIAGLLGNSDPRAQFRLTQALAKMEGTHAAIPALLRLSPSIAPESIYGPDAVAVGAAGGDEATAILLDLVRSDDPSLTRRALGVLAHAGPYTPEVVRLLVRHEDDYWGMPWRAKWADTLGAKAALAELVQDPDVGLRRFAVTHLANAPADPARAVPALVTALGDAEPDIRASACSGLLALAKDAASATEPLTLAAQDPEEAVRKAASRALQVIASASGPGAEARSAEHQLNDALYDLGHVDQATRQQAARELGRMGAAAVPALIEQLRSADRVRRRGAARALGYAGESAAPARPDLLVALNDTEQDVRAAAFSALAETCAQPEDLPLLMDGLNDPDRRFAAIEGLANLGADAAPAVPRLIEIMRTDPEWTVRTAAMSTLGGLGQAGAEAEPYVREALDDSQWEIRERALQALLQWHPDDLTPVVTLLDDPDRFSISAALRCCRKLGPKAAPLAPALREVLFDASLDWRAYAAEALWAATGETETALETLTRALRDEKPWRVPVALHVLEGMGAAAQPAAPEVRPFLDRPDPSTRLAAARALWAMTGDPDRVVPSLVAELQGRPRDATAAAKLLGKIGPPAEAAVPALDAVRYCRDDGLYEAARQAILAIQTEG